MEFNQPKPAIYTGPLKWATKNGDLQPLAGYKGVAHFKAIEEDDFLTWHFAPDKFPRDMITGEPKDIWEWRVLEENLQFV